MARATSKEKKLAVLELIKEKKHILFGSFSNNAVEKGEKVKAWEEVLRKAQSLGLAKANQSWTYARDHIFGLWKSRTLTKTDNARRTGTAGGKAAIMDEIDNRILDIIGADSPAVQGLGVAETDGVSATSNMASTSSTIAITAAPPPPSLAKKNLKRGASESIDLLKQQLIETEIYKNKLKILKLEKELGLPTSKFTADIVAATNGAANQFSFLSNDDESDSSKKINFDKF